MSRTDDQGQLNEDLFHKDILCGMRYDSNRKLKDQTERGFFKETPRER